MVYQPFGNISASQAVQCEHELNSEPRIHSYSHTLSLSLSLKCSFCVCVCVWLCVHDAIRAVIRNKLSPIFGLWLFWYGLHEANGCCFEVSMMNSCCFLLTLVTVLVATGQGLLHACLLGLFSAALWFVTCSFLGLKFAAFWACYIQFVGLKICSFLGLLHASFMGLKFAGFWVYYKQFCGLKIYSFVGLSNAIFMG